VQRNFETLDLKSEDIYNQRKRIDIADEK